MAIARNEQIRLAFDQRIQDSDHRSGSAATTFRRSFPAGYEARGFKASMNARISASAQRGGEQSWGNVARDRSRGEIACDATRWKLLGAPGSQDSSRDAFRENAADQNIGVEHRPDHAFLRATLAPEFVTARTASATSRSMAAGLAAWTGFPKVIQQSGQPLLCFFASLQLPQRHHRRHGLAGPLDNVLVPFVIHFFQKLTEVLPSLNCG